MHPIVHRATLRLIAAVLLSLTAQPRAAAAQSCTAPIHPPWTITLPDDLRAFVTQLVDGSPTFHSQWQALVSSRLLRLSVKFVAIMGQERARATVHRYQYGLIVAEVELPFGDDAELLAHEFEHVLEQVEGVDLRHVAQDRTAGVRDLGYGYETERAYAVGRRVAQEWARYLKTTSTRPKQAECHTHD